MKEALKKEITLAFNESRVFDDEKKAYDVWKENFQNLSDINENILREAFHDAPFVLFDPDKGVGLVSNSNEGNNTKIKSAGNVGKHFEEVVYCNFYTKFFVIL